MLRSTGSIYVRKSLTEDKMVQSGNALSFLNSKGKFHVQLTSKKASLTSFQGKILVNLKDGQILTGITGG